MSDPFAFDDVAGGAAALGALPASLDARLAARAARGESPLPAVAELARRGDPKAARVLACAAPMLATDDVAALGLAGSPGADALACMALASWLPLPLRVAAVEAVPQSAVTPAAWAAVSELAAGPHKPPWTQAEAAVQALGPKLSPAVRDEADRLRNVARQVREGVRGVIHRQGFQREVAAGSLHPVVGMLVGDDGDFLAGIVPPIADAARERLLPFLVALLRGPSDPHRARVLAFLQRRWRDLAAPALSAIARTPAKAKEAAVVLASVKALAAMGALDELAVVVGAAPGVARAAALTALASATERSPFDGDVALLRAALARASGDPDAAVRARADELSARLAP